MHDFETKNDILRLLEAIFTPKIGLGGQHSCLGVFSGAAGPSFPYSLFFFASVFFVFSVVKLLSFFSHPEHPVHPVKISSSLTLAFF